MDPMTTTSDDPTGQPTAPLTVRRTGTGRPGTANEAGDQLLAAAVGDTCSNCGAQLAPDQRYCVECGERRGKPRFSLASGSAAASQRDVAPRASGRWSSLRASSSATLVAGIATLLLAMGVGVLIGHSNGGKSQAQVITVNGGSGAAATTTPTTATTTPTAVAPTKAAKGKKSTKAAAQTRQVITTVKAPPPKAIQPGQACSNGTAGCQNGKFNGNFFGN
jgi:hypothetical protein